MAADNLSDDPQALNTSHNTRVKMAWFGNMCEDTQKRAKAIVTNDSNYSPVVTYILGGVKLKDSFVEKDLEGIIEVKDPQSMNYWLALRNLTEFEKPLRGQIICKHGTQKPCYKVIYFHDTSRRLTFNEAQEECRRDGGYLLVIKTEAEQKLIQKLIQSLTASDGDFWLGLRRDDNDFPNSSDCQSLYTWVDGSKPSFWNWYVDEPSCGSEVCVVMYYQPFASPGVGGPYMFQWNDDRCNMKNNFICKYSEGQYYLSSNEKQNTRKLSPLLETRHPHTQEITENDVLKVTDSPLGGEGIKELLHDVKVMADPTSEDVFSSGTGFDSNTNLWVNFILVVHIGTGLEVVAVWMVRLGVLIKSSSPLHLMFRGITIPLLQGQTAKQNTKLRNIGYRDPGTMTTKEPEISIRNTNETAKEAEESYLHFILIATIPVLTLLLIFIGVICCCIIERRKQQRSETDVKEPSFWMSPHRRNSPNLEIYNVIKRQTEADLAGTRPNIRNTSFRVPSGETSPPDNLSGDYDNIGSMERKHSESGFVTLASTESGFVTNELYELCNNRYGRSTESGWVENEIYGY
ncbi:layilin [Gastrophryne carolinensis]